MSHKKFVLSRFDSYIAHMEYEYNFSILKILLEGMFQYR